MIEDIHIEFVSGPTVRRFLSLRDEADPVPVDVSWAESRIPTYSYNVLSICVGTIRNIQEPIETHLFPFFLHRSAPAGLWLTIEHVGGPLGELLLASFGTICSRTLGVLPHKLAMLPATCRKVGSLKKAFLPATVGCQKKRSQLTCQFPSGACCAFPSGVRRCQLQISFQQESLKMTCTLHDVAAQTRHAASCNDTTTTFDRV